MTNSLLKNTSYNFLLFNRWMERQGNKWNGCSNYLLITNSDQVYYQGFRLQQECEQVPMSAIKNSCNANRRHLTRPTWYYITLTFSNICTKENNKQKFSFWYLPNIHGELPFHKSGNCVAPPSCYWRQHHVFQRKTYLMGTSHRSSRALLHFPFDT